MGDRSSAHRGPASDIHRAAGPLSLGPQTEIRCQVLRRGGKLCDRQLAVVDGFAEPLPYTVEALELVREGHHGGWCERCERVSLYIVRSEG